MSQAICRAGPKRPTHGSVSERTFSSYRAARLANLGSVTISDGYWFFSWADGYLPLQGVQPLPSGVINVTVANLQNPREDGGSIKPGARFYGVNLLCELDAPSEYYIDDEEGVLYFWPPKGAGSPAQWEAGACGVSANDTAVNASNTSNVVLRGLTVTGAVHTGIEGSGVESVLVRSPAQ